ncbi:MAG: EAL domain-containing protein [Pseudomonadota bacterium]
MAWLTALAWTLAVGASLGWNLYQEEAQIMRQAYAEARANLNKDITFRRWGNSHGGVYVPITDSQQSVPWLSHVPGRDVMTVDGRALTLLNPASMLRQMMDRYADEYGIRGRITGLKYLNPGNAPDPWEKTQLQAFTRGDKQEVWAVADIDGKPYLRYLRAMYMEPGCEKCHAILGYKRGDMRGATGLNLPLAPYLNTLEQARLTLGLTHLGIWLLGLTGIGWAGWQQSRRGAERADLLTALGASEERFDLAMRGANDGILDLDLRSGQAFHSPRLAEMLGYAPGELPAGLPGWRGIIHPDDYAAVADAYQEHRDGATPRFEATFRVLHKTGSWHWLMSRGQALRDEAGRAVRFVGVHTDISEQKAIEARLYEERERAQVTLASIGDAVLTTDAEGNVTFMNGMAESLTGWRRGEAAGLPVESVVVLVNEESREHAPNPVTLSRQTGQAASLAEHTLLINREGREYAIDDSAAPIHDREGRLVGVVMVFHDVTATRELTRQMRWQVTHDRLTGLHSRQEFEHRLGALVEEARDGRGEHALLYMDLDNFKIVNDTCGHLAGDELLKQLAFLLAEHMRRNDTLGRLGGDEFAALLENCPLEKAQDIAENLRQAVQDFRFTWEGKNFDVGVSIGLTMVDRDTASSAEALAAADVACYAAKDGGRNRVHVHTRGSQESATRRQEMHLAANIRSALDGGRFVLYAQEIRALHPGTREGRHYEVLVRMLDEHGELVQPGMFIPAAERYSLMPQVDCWVVENTLARMAEHSSRDMALTINLSGLCFRDEDTVRCIRQALERHGIAPGRITFEITETAAVAQLTQAVAFMRQMKALGCRFALDDFGSGMSSFSYLKTLPVDVLKIDGAFVRDMQNDPADRAFVEAIHRVAHTLGKETVAEFAESDDIIAALKEIGVDYAQGYAIGKPRPLENVLQGL